MKYNFFLPRIFREFLLKIKKELTNFKLLAFDYGQWNSIWHLKSQDVNFNPIPWYTYPALEYLEHLDFSQMLVFEYGSGNSTLWWAERCKGIQSVEDDEAWYLEIEQKINIKNVHYVLEQRKNEYVSMATENSDVFIIDGSYRRACAEYVIQLAGGMMIILDNSDWFPETVDVLRSTLGWFELDFHGFGPINGYTWTTTIFINPKRYNELFYKRNLSSRGCLKQVSSEDKLH
jgi:hypothetical protein